jgi:WRKY transcription factor 22
MEGDQGWCRGGSSNNWDLHAVVRFACGDAAPTSAPPSDDDAFPWPGPLQPLLTDPAVDELCQALLAAPKPEAPQPSSPAIQQPAQAKPRRGGGGPTRSKRKYVLHLSSSCSIDHLWEINASPFAC